MTSATEELRRMLDERGVEWWAEDDPEEPAYCFVTKWFANGCEQTYEEIPAIRSRSLKAYCVTPEQAIAATLGTPERTCRWTPADYITEGDWWNTGCGESITWEPDGVPSYCPNCGRKAVKR